MRSLLFGLASCFLALFSWAAERPNIILFYADDLGYTDLSCQGSDFYETPNIDRLAKEGMTFTQAYAAAANCAPSRASLLTGLYTPRHGVFTVGNSDRGKSAHRKLIPLVNDRVLPRQLPTVAKALANAHYSTAMAGKWHLSPDPTKYGFDQNFGGLQWGAPKSYFSPYKNPVLKDGPKGEHLPARLANEVCTWIRSTQNSPPKKSSQFGSSPKPASFFLYYPFYSVHTPIQARQDLTAKYTKKKPGTNHRHAKYAAMIEAMDLAIGRVLGELDKLQIANETLVVFTSDNGPFGGVGDARPLRGDKGHLYEGGIRVPLIVRWPGRIKAGAESAEPVILTDFYPTLLEVAGLKPKSDHPGDGESLLALLTGEGKPKREAIFWHYPNFAFHQDNRLGSAIRMGDYKLLEFFDKNEVELYNLKADLGEKNDLAKDMPELAAKMRKRLQAWLLDSGAKMPRTR